MNFRSELDRVTALIETFPTEPLYWCGYRRGLQRAFLGRRFTSNTDHYAWLDFSRDDDPFLAELGRGYRAALAAVAIGRPQEVAVWPPPSLRETVGDGPDRCD